jgi:hypothetical protein
MRPKRPADTAAAAQNIKKRRTDTVSINTSPSEETNNVGPITGVGDEAHQSQDSNVPASESSTKDNTEDEEN